MTGKIGRQLIVHLKAQWYASWKRHQMETCSALLDICVGNSPVPGEFPEQRPVTQSFNVFFDLRLNKQPKGRWFETLSRPLWRHCNVNDEATGKSESNISYYILARCLWRVKLQPIDDFFIALKNYTCRYVHFFVTSGTKYWRCFNLPYRKLRQIGVMAYINLHSLANI